MMKQSQTRSEFPNNDAAKANLSRAAYTGEASKVLHISVDFRKEKNFDGNAVIGER
jgi:hypothetical protein